MIGNEDLELGATNITKAHNSVFLFVMRDKTSMTETIFSLSVHYHTKSKLWILKTRPVYVSSFAKILALKIDQESINQFDSYWTLNGSLEIGKKVTN